MPENVDGRYTTDQNRSGGRQTEKPDRFGAGTKDSRDAFGDEEKKREIARDSKHPDNVAEEWSPGTDQPNT